MVFTRTANVRNYEVLKISEEKQIICIHVKVKDIPVLTREEPTEWIGTMNMGKIKNVNKLLC